MKIRIIALVVAAVAAVVIAAWTLSRSPQVPITVDDRFRRVDVTIRDYDLFDLGVADADGDGHLDIFTANHSSLQSLLLGDGSGGFEEAYSRLGLDQDRAFPVLEDSLDAPLFDRPGLYIYRQARWLYLTAHDVDAAAPVSGTLALPWPVRIGDAPSTTEVIEQDTGSGGVTSTVSFSLHGNERIRMIGRDDIVELPHRLTFSADVDLASLFIGQDGVHPESHSFDMTWRDRHGMAFADYDGDGFVDVFIARGGVKGQLDKVSAAIADELFAGSPGGFSDRAGALALEKGNCPARQTSWVDFDGDGDLDVYVSCGRGDAPDYPNQLFRQDADGRFDDVAGKLGLDFGQASVYAWVDADSDNDLDLVAAEQGRLYLYRNDGGSLSRSEIVQDWLTDDPYQFSIADFDNDGDLDLFAAHRSRSLLLVNTGGSFEPRTPAELGLPNGARAAVWVDFDNDGLVDLHAIPGGVYRQDGDHRFSATGMLRQAGDVERIQEGRISWADFDEDGQRDLVMALRAGVTLRQRLERRLTGRQPDLGTHWRSAVYLRENATANHWLTIALHGATQNRPAIGARVTVTTAAGRQLQQVGAAEGSHYGQGHYRLYFGLGDEATATSVRVTWPDGRSQVIEDVPADRQLDVNYAPD